MPLDHRQQKNPFPSIGKFRNSNHRSVNLIVGRITLSRDATRWMTRECEDCPWVCVRQSEEESVRLEMQRP